MERWPDDDDDDIVHDPDDHDHVSDDPDHVLDDHDDVPAGLLHLPACPLLLNRERRWLSLSC